MIEAEWWEYDLLDELADAVAGDVGFIVESAVEARNASLIAVAGGRTGPAVFPKLAAQKLPWKRVTIIPTDDRLVPMDDELSNVRALAKTFPAGWSARGPDRRRHRRLPAGGQFRRRAAAGPAVAARSRLARHGRGRAYRLDFPRAGPAGRARCAQGTARDRRDARPAAGRSAGAACDSDPRRDPVGADDPDDDHRRRKSASCSKARSPTGKARSCRSAACSPKSISRSTSTGVRERRRDCP